MYDLLIQNGLVYANGGVSYQTCALKVKKSLFSIVIQDLRRAERSTLPEKHVFRDLLTLMLISEIQPHTQRGFLYGNLRRRQQWYHDGLCPAQYPARSILLQNIYGAGQ